ncbi:MAG: DnaJ domain-containing protein [Butyrivibrio sp.]|nr:DnaJ domain-containing protein [Acetatifactor muris]MCM1558543.1 DnaJ domain-containing protein [Butyrivibrio sp.]
MNIWEILGIPPTTDVTAIKKAYADRAKKWHPEEHPEEFKRLRNAYQTAVKLAKSGAAVNMGSDMKPPQPEQAEAPGPQFTERGAGFGPQFTERGAGFGPQFTERGAQSGPQFTERGAQSGPQFTERRAQSGPQFTERGAESGARQTEAEEEPQPRFSYEDVSSFYQKEVEEQFFEEFHQIAWNPYLQNKKAVWNYFLLKPEFDNLYSHGDFLRRLLWEIRGVPGWYTETLEFFERWLKLYEEDDKKDQGDRSWVPAAARAWSRKKWRSKYTSFMPEQVVSWEQRRKHYEILQSMKDRGVDESLMNVTSAAVYLKYYRAFLQDNEYWLEYQRRFCSRKFLKRWIRSSALLVFLGIVLVLVLVVRPILNEAKKKEEEAILQESREQERLEQEIREQEERQREQEEWQRELERRIETMQEQYRDWMEQQE